MFRITPVLTAIFIFVILLAAGHLLGASSRGILPALLAAVGIAESARQDGLL